MTSWPGSRGRDCDVSWAEKRDPRAGRAWGFPSLTHRGHQLLIYIYIFWLGLVCDGPPEARGFTGSGRGVV